MLDQVGSNLYQGRAMHDMATVVDQHDIDRVISVTSFETTVTDHHIPLADTGGKNSAETVRTAIKAVTGGMEKNKTVFVFCSAGRNRSVVVAAAALAVQTDQTLETALADIEAERGWIQPDPALVERAADVVNE